MRNILILISVLLVLISCGDNIKREEDKHPEIPEYPLFLKNSLVYRKLYVATVSFNNNKSKDNLVIHTKDYFFYTVTDSTLFIITGYREAVEPGREFPAKNFITLTRVKNSKIETEKWTEICDQEIPIINNGDTLHIGRKKIDLKSTKLISKKDVFYADEISKDKKFISSWDPYYEYYNIDYKMIYDSTVIKEFGRVTIGSGSHLTGSVGAINWSYHAIPLIYYQFKSNGKTGLTKINFDEQKPPLLVKIQDKIYCITHSEPSELNRKVINYEIGILE
ncbi:hypothetical protein [Flavobacterium branchiophilum]|uniref:Lipoprotein n=1 Tax=Flavobacterium branchiophilum TaxID=55197 RepID=A0A2H3KFB8_9FLAO|nr:hypothetical protein [Flavobacterium branchiophilum]PDS25879.1 hypothetical protein B0A77_03700 [Flavobacterium branchiophilum]